MDSNGKGTGFVFPALILGNDWHVVLADMGEVQNGTLLAENKKHVVEQGQKNEKPGRRRG